MFQLIKDLAIVASPAFVFALITVAQTQGWL